MKIFGLTGGPGCGKSTVSAYLSKSAFWRVYDADAVCHELYADPESGLVNAIRSRWGGKTIAADGSVNRKVLAGLVMGHAEELNALNQIAHPAITAEIRRRIREDEGRFPAALLDAALLFEAGWDSLTDADITVWTDRNTQMARLRTRGWSDAECRMRMDAQISADEKLARADFGILNYGSLEFLYEQCDILTNNLQR